MEPSSARVATELVLPLELTELSPRQPLSVVPTSATSATNAFWPIRLDEPIYKQAHYKDAWWLPTQRLNSVCHGTDDCANPRRWRTFRRSRRSLFGRYAGERVAYEGRVHGLSEAAQHVARLAKFRSSSGDDGRFSSFPPERSQIGDNFAFRARVAETSQCDASVPRAPGPIPEVQFCQDPSKTLRCPPGPPDPTLEMRDGIGHFELSRALNARFFVLFLRSPSNTRNNFKNDG
jgi:hypothetical protein